MENKNVMRFFCEIETNVEEFSTVKFLPVVALLNDKNVEAVIFDARRGFTGESMQT
jgi:hypothetical protein